MTALDALLGAAILICAPALFVGSGIFMVAVLESFQDWLLNRRR